MPCDERLSLLLSTLAQVALSVELQPTLQILLDSLQTLVPFDGGGIFVCDAERKCLPRRRAPASAGCRGGSEGSAEAQPTARLAPASRGAGSGVRRRA